MNDYERIEKVIRYLDEHFEDQPSLSTLARVAGLSEFHFHRLFSRWAGITPKGFLKFMTSACAKDLLRQSRSVLDAAFGAGLSGPGRLHDLLVSVEGVTPGEFKAKGLGTQIRYGIHSSPFGSCLIAMTDRGICHLSFLDKKDRKAVINELRAEWPNAKIVHEPVSTGEVVSRIFQSPSNGQQGSLRTFLVGSPFQLKVWEALIRIPAGMVASYGDIARSIGTPGLARAVGTAIGSNRVAYLIPCHRVIRETGAFGEYRWGALRKSAILAWEARSQAPEMEMSVSRR